MSARILYLRVHYETLEQDLSKSELLLSNLSSFAKFLDRVDSISSNKVIASKNFIKVLEAIIKAKSNIKYRSKEALLSLLKRNQPITVRRWLQQKIEELER